MNSPETIANIVKARCLNEFTDYSLICEGRQFPVHKIILCSQPSVFHAACTGSFAESGEAYTIKDFTPEMVRRMVDYLYTGDYDNASSPGSADLKESTGLLLHAIMFSLADKYLMAGLRAKSAKKFNQIINQGPELIPFLRSVTTVYELTADCVRDLRSSVVYYAREHLPLALDSPGVREVYDEVCTNVPGFAQDLLDSFLRHPVLGTCSNCGYGKRVPIEVLQSRCKLCHKGGASACKSVRAW